MKRILTSVFALAIVLFGFAFLLPTLHIAAADEQSVAQADREFVSAAARGDHAAMGKLLDAEFTWTDADGYTRPRTQVLGASLHPVLGTESDAKVERRNYGAVEAIMAGHEKFSALRIWVKRASAWRLLVYHEVELGRTPGGPGGKDCENPCKTVPYKPRNEAEAAIIASWQALETGVTNHDSAAWAPHIADEFAMLGSTNDHPLTKADRIATLDLQKQTGRNSAPAPLVSAQMFDFGDAIIMTCLHQPYVGKAVHVSRVWIKRDGKWVMAISYQTTIQSSPSKS
jgi:hypothetical protein